MPPGPTPKNPATRQRRNRPATQATLETTHGVDCPALPERAWHPQTVEWWTDIWASPMAGEWEPSERHELFLLAVLVDQFWTEPTPKLAAEIRLQRQCFGLTTMDRWRLKWEINRGDKAAAKEKPRRARPKGDPRAHLSAVS